jgi:plastocyanin
MMRQLFADRAARSITSSPSANAQRRTAHLLNLEEAFRMSRMFKVLSLVVPSVAFIACGDTNSPDLQVSMRDSCDIATFNAGLGAGTCTHQGSVTLAQFNTELDATQRVAAWTFDPTALTIHVGDRLVARNDGGEKHTFTEVANFGGGIVPALNQASGNPTETPECAALTAGEQVSPGSSFSTDEATTVGTEHYQCCIHPWMRATVTVLAR